MTTQQSTLSEMQNAFSKGCGGHAAHKKFKISIMRFHLVEISTNLRSFQIAQQKF